VSDQVGRLVHVSNLYRTTPQRQLATKLAEITGGKQAFFANSGAESIECALKLARKWALEHKGPGSFRVVAAENGFHGRTLGALAATGQPTKQEPFAPMVPGFTHVPYGDSGALREAMDGTVAAVLLEPIQGEAGVVVPPDGYLAEAQALCDEHSALLILDEVQTGIGRTGHWFAGEHFGVEADIICAAKGLGGGLPIAACLATDELAATFSYGDHGSTFGGGPVQAAAALAVIDVIESQGLLERASTAGHRLMAGLDSASGDLGLVRGLGLLIGLRLRRPEAREVAESALAKGLLVNDATPDVVRITPPLVITDEEIDRALRLIGEVFDEISTA
jgi:acetylornithine/N-succinyldiaminopimelate aminotransferase